VIGCRQRIKNDSPIIGSYDVNNQGSGDMYYKGGNMLHMLRHMINDDEKWRSILRGLNKTFWHQTVSTVQIEKYLSEQSGLKLDQFFEQYLRTTRIPVFKYSVDGKNLKYQFTNVVAGFSIPIEVIVNGADVSLVPTEAMQAMEFDREIESVELNRNFYLNVER
jgi:aminopeptidase N